MDVNEINEEIKLTLNLIQTEVDGTGASNELQYHLMSLLEMKRNELQQRLVERSWSEPISGTIETVTHDQAPYKGVKLDGQITGNSRPLTADELKAGGWWLDEVSDQALQELFLEYGVKITGVSNSWFNASGDTACVISSSDYGRDLSGFKQIDGIGNEFYWSEACKHSRQYR